MNFCSACTRCGYTTRDGSQNFCPKCGKKLKYLDDEREMPELEQKRKEYAEYEKLREKFGR